MELVRQLSQKQPAARISIVEATFDPIASWLSTFHVSRNHNIPIVQSAQFVTMPTKDRCLVS